MSEKRYIIRKSVIDDIGQVEDAHIRSIKQLCSRDYNEQEIDAYSDVRYSMDVWEQSVTQDYHIVVELDGKVEGFGYAKIHSTDKGEIAGFYFTPLIAGKGIGREVFDRMNMFFKKQDVTTVFLTSSKTAKDFYEKMGFSTRDRVTVNLRGVDLECYNMDIYISPNETDKNA